MADDSQDYFAQAGQQYGVDPLLLRAVAAVESGGTQDPTHAVSPQGAQGRMQFMPATAKAMGVSDPSDDSQAIPGAARYLVQGYQATGTPEGALMYYHGGPDRSIWGPKTQAYVGKVTQAYQALKGQAAGAGTAPVQVASANTGNATDGTSAAATAPPPAPPAPASSYLAFGDSLARGVRDAGGIPGESKVGATPWEVLKQIGATPADSVRGKTVILSSGVSNNPQAFDLVAQQIAALKAKGAADVRLVGVGSRADLAPMNADLANVAQAGGATFLGPVAADAGGVHPKDYKGLLAAATRAPVPSPAPGNNITVTAPSAPAASAPANDYLATKWGVGQSAPPPAAAAVAAPPTDDYLTKTWGIAPPAPVKTSPAALATPPTTLQSIGAGALRGAHDLLDKPAELLARAGDYFGVTGSPWVPTAPQVTAADAAGSAQYDQQYGNNRLANAASMATKIGASLFPAGAAGRLVEAGAGLIPGAGTLAGRLFTSAASGAAQGATASSVMGDPIGPGAALGGAVGAALPPVLAGLKYGVNATQAGADYLTGTAGASDRTARATIDRFAGTTPTVPPNPLLVPGSNPTLAEATGNTGVARLQAGVAADPVLGGLFNARSAANADARVAALEKATGDEPALEAAIKARSAIAPDFTAKQPVNPQPLIDAVKAELDGPGGGELALKAKLQQLNGLLVDAKGNPLPQASDPEYLYQSVRKSIGNVMSGLDPNGQRGAVASNVMRVLGQNIQPVLDQTIEGGVPGFQQYLANYSAASRPIDAMKFLQGQKLVDNQGRITLSKVQSALDKIDTANSARTKGINAAQSVDPTQYQSLQAIRDDLLRSARATEGVKATGGSNTAQNLATQRLIGSAAGSGALGGALGEVPRTAADVLGILGGDQIYGGTGAAAGFVAAHSLSQMAKAAIAARGQLSNEAAKNRLAELLLNPQEYAQQPHAGAFERYVGNPLLTALGSVRPMIPGAVVAGRRQNALVDAGQP